MKTDDYIQLDSGWVLPETTSFFHYDPLGRKFYIGPLRISLRPSFRISETKNSKGAWDRHIKRTKEANRLWRIKNAGN